MIRFSENSKRVSKLTTKCYQFGCHEPAYVFYVKRKFIGLNEPGRIKGVKFDILTFCNNHKYPDQHGKIINPYRFYKVFKSLRDVSEFRNSVKYMCNIAKCCKQAVMFGANYWVFVPKLKSYDAFIGYCGSHYKSMKPKFQEMMSYNEVVMMQIMEG